MIAILISACLVADPNTCRDFKIPLDAGYSERTCAMHAPPHFAKWSQEHPGWEIKKWRCRPTTVDEI